MKNDGYTQTGLKAISRAELERSAARIAREDEERARSRRAWDRLCGMAAPIGGPAER